MLGWWYRIINARKALNATAICLLIAAVLIWRFSPIAAAILIVAAVLPVGRTVQLYRRQPRLNTRVTAKWPRRSFAGAADWSDRGGHVRVLHGGSE
jgi:hypothetical protein